MKKVLLSLGIIALVAGVVAGASFAFFSDTATVEGNTFSTGSADLEIRRVDAGNWGDSITGVNFDNIYPGWVAEEEIKLRNDSSADIGMDIVPYIEISNDGSDLRHEVTLQFLEGGEELTDEKTLNDWRNNEEVLKHLENGEVGEELTLKFTLPSTGELQNDLQDSYELNFDLIFDGIQAETPITEVTNETQGETYDNLEAAIDVADSGDTILLPDGTYDGFALDKGLTLKGVGDNVVINSKKVSGEPRPNGIFIQTNDEINVENVRFENGGIDMAEFPQGVLTSGDYDPVVNISNSTFMDLHMGVYFNPGASGVITNNEFDDINHAAIGIDSDAGVDITDNYITNASVGLEIFGENVTYSDNTFDSVNTDIDDQS